MPYWPRARVECLEEIQAIMLRHKGMFFCRPTIGRVAIAGFSAGTQVVANTLGSILRHPFLSSKLHEVYMFDPNASSISVLNERLQILNAFLQQGAAEERSQKMARYYTQNTSAAARAILATFLGVRSADFSGTPTEVTVLDSADTQRTTGVFPDSRCPALDDSGNITFEDPDDWLVMHHLIPALLLSDALTRSGFARVP